MTIFDWFKQVTYIKDPWSSFSEEDKATFNPYMMHRLVSMYEPYLELANYLQQFWQLKPDQIYLIYCKYLPENKVFAKYIKSTKSKVNSELLDTLANYYQISTREIKEYLHILNKDEVKNILSSRGIDDDEIKKLLKDEKTTKASKASTRA
jgi:wyosine [tRNA(Phe)-imidazoG37] synthetase (radical SAM superfamily)